MGEILFIYRPFGLKSRKTISDSIFCFKHAEKSEHNVYFYDYTHNRDTWKRLLKQKFDVVIYHYTFMTLRSDPNIWIEAQERLKTIRVKESAVIIQDEYIYSKYTQEFLKNMNIKKVFTLARGENIHLMYPEVKADFYTVLPGYADIDSLETIKKLEKEIGNKRNTIDIGYRARKLSYSLGRQGLLKTEISDIFNDALKHTELKTDISTTGDTKNVFLGLDWYRFLIKCRTMLGCMGGASILDPDGALFEKISKYMSKHPDAGYTEIKERFLQEDGNIDYSALSPRFFECAMTKTCQVLVEGDYGDVMKPGIHFIEVKRDFSNVDDVIEQIKDRELCERIAQNAYIDLIENGSYTYDAYVDYVISKLTLKKDKKKRNRLTDRYLAFNDFSINSSMKIKLLLKSFCCIFSIKRDTKDG